jgi:hypothetical protein
MSSSKETPSTYGEVKSDDHTYRLEFHCYNFSRRISLTASNSPRSRRHVTATQCLFVPSPYFDPSNWPNLDPTDLYRIDFYENWDDEVAERKERNAEQGFAEDRIGVFIPHEQWANIHVPSSFLDHLWDAAVAADGVLRSISMTVQLQKTAPRERSEREREMEHEIHKVLEQRLTAYQPLPEGVSRGDKKIWAVLNVSLDEKIADGIELRDDKDGHPTISPPRENPAIRELRRVQAKLELLAGEENPTVRELQRVQAQLKSLKGWSGIAVVAIGVLLALWIAHLWR